MRECLVRIEEICLTAGRDVRGEHAHIVGRIQMLARMALGPHVASREVAPQVLTLHLWELLDSLDPAPEQPVREGAAETVDFTAIRDRIAVRLGLVRP